MVVSGYDNLEYINRLQKYSKIFAKTLRFRYCSLFLKDRYSYSYYIDVEEQNLINELESKDELESKLEKEKEKENGILKRIFHFFRRLGL